MVQIICRDDFRDFAEFCFKEYGQKVKHWITLNEPVMFASKGYGTGELAPGRGAEWDPSRYLGGNSGTEPYTVGHHLILAHAAAANLYKTKYQVLFCCLIKFKLGAHVYAYLN